MGSLPGGVCAGLGHLSSRFLPNFLLKFAPVALVKALNRFNHLGGVGGLALNLLQKQSWAELHYLNIIVIQTYPFRFCWI